MIQKETAIIHFRPAAGADAHRHADLDLAGPDGPDLPVHLYQVPLESVA
jgi:hypothetical protein